MVVIGAEVDKEEEQQGYEIEMTRNASLSWIVKLYLIRDADVGSHIYRPRVQHASFHGTADEAETSSCNIGPFCWCSQRGQSCSGITSSYTTVSVQSIHLHVRLSELDTDTLMLKCFSRTNDRG